MPMMQVRPMRMAVGSPLVPVPMHMFPLRIVGRMPMIMMAVVVGVAMLVL